MKYIVSILGKLPIYGHLNITDTVGYISMMYFLNFIVKNICVRYSFVVMRSFYRRCMNKLAISLYNQKQVGCF